MLASNYVRYRYRYLGLFLVLTGAGLCYFFLGIDASLGVLLTAMFSLSLFLFIKGYYFPCIIGKKLQAELGFKYGTCHIRDKWGLSEMLQLESVTPGGLFDQAGFQEKDIIMDNLAIAEFFQLLHKQRGRDPITFRVAFWDDSQLRTALQQTRLVTVHVPSKRENGDTLSTLSN